MEARSHMADPNVMRILKKSTSPRRLVHQMSYVSLRNTRRWCCSSEGTTLSATPRRRRDVPITSPGESTPVGDRWRYARYFNGLSKRVRVLT